jgi:hypothetical protein
MPRNRLMYYGVLIVAASALIWIGAWLTRRIEWILPYTGMVGVFLIVTGVAIEFRNRRLQGVTEAADLVKSSRQTIP